MYQTLLKPLALDAKTFVLDTLFPIYCIVCEKEGKFVCDFCAHNLTVLENQRCIACQKPSAFGITHPTCQTPHMADGLISFYDYHNENVAKIIISGKYNFLPGVFEALAGMMVNSIKNDYPNLLATGYQLTALPLHSRRLRWRGFNQAEVLCQTLSQNLNLNIANVLVRSKATTTQKDLKKEKRIKNVEGAFKLKDGASVHGQNYIIVDDVTTTGATLLQAAQTLKRNGAAKVFCLTVARD